MTDLSQQAPQTPPAINSDAPSTEFLLDPQTGHILETPSEMIPQALQSGFHLATPENIQNYKNQKTYGEGALNQVESALLGAGEGATFGGSTWLGTKSGLLDPEAVRQIEERNPISHGAGMVGGILGSSFLLPGEGAVGAASKLGNAVSEGESALVTPVLSSIAKASPMAGKVLDYANQIGSKALGSAIEGALYGGLGNTITESALGDPDLNGEKILGNFGLGALIGGSFGGALKAGEIALPGAWNTAKDAMGKLYDIAVGAPGAEPGVLSKAYANVSSIMSGRSASEILQGIKNRAGSAATPEALEGISSGVTKNLNGLLYHAQNLLSSVEDDIPRQDIGSLLKNVPLEDVAQVADQAHAIINNASSEMMINSNLSPSLTKFQKIGEDFADQLSKENGIETSADLYKALSSTQDKIEALASKSGINEIQNASQGFSGLLKNPDTWGSAIARESSLSNSTTALKNATSSLQKLFVKNGEDDISQDAIKEFLQNPSTPKGSLQNNAISNFINEMNGFLDQAKTAYENVPPSNLNPKLVNELLDKHVDLMNDATSQNLANQAASKLSSGNPGGIPSLLTLGAFAKMPWAVPFIEGSKMLANPGMAISRLAKLEGILNTSTNAIERGTSAIFKTGYNALDTTEGLLSQKLSGSKLIDLHNDFAENLKKNLENPENFIDKITNSTQPLYDAAPKTATALNIAAGRAANFLQSKLPGPPDPTSPFEKKQNPSLSDVSIFDRYKTIVENPLDILSQVKSDSITPQAIEALSTVYPKLYGKIKESVLERMSSLKDPDEIPYDRKLSLSMLMGEPLDKSLSPSNIASNISLYNAAMTENAPHGAAPAKKSRTAALGKITLADRSQTSFQQAASRQA